MSLTMSGLDCHGTPLALRERLAISRQEMPALLGWLPGFLGEIPFLQVGIPAILSAYFDVFSGCIQAFIFAMLTMLYISGGYPGEELASREARRKEKAAMVR